MGGMSGIEGTFANLGIATPASTLPYSATGVAYSAISTGLELDAIGEPYMLGKEPSGVSSPTLDIARFPTPENPDLLDSETEQEPLEQPEPPPIPFLPPPPLSNPSNSSISKPPISTPPLFNPRLPTSSVSAPAYIDSQPSYFHPPHPDPEFGSEDEESDGAGGLDRTFSFQTPKNDESKLYLQPSSARGNSRPASFGGTNSGGGAGVNFAGSAGFRGQTVPIPTSAPMVEVFPPRNASLGYSRPAGGQGVQNGGVGWVRGQRG